LSQYNEPGAFMPTLPQLIAAADWSGGEELLVHLARERLQSGASSKETYNGLTALEVAVAGGWANLAEMLIEHGAQVHQGVRSAALRVACTNAATACIDVLTRHGAVVSRQDIVAAAACGRDDVMLAVLKNCHAHGAPHNKVYLGADERGTSMRNSLLKRGLPTLCVSSSSSWANLPRRLALRECPCSASASQKRARS
jgi:hypothetical protein